MNLFAVIAAGEIDPARSIHWLWPAAAELIYGSLASILIFGLLYKFAGPAVRKAMADRTAKIQGELDASAEARSSAESEAADIRRAAGDIASERQRLLADADAQAEALLSEGRARLAAEEKASRASREVAEQAATIESLRRRIDEIEVALGAAEGERDTHLEELRAERVALRNERDRHAATRARLERAAAATEQAESDRAEAEVVRDRVIDERRSLLDDTERLTEMVHQVESLLAGLRSLMPERGADDRRRPVPIPGSSS